MKQFVPGHRSESGVESRDRKKLGLVEEQRLFDSARTGILFDCAGHEASVIDVVISISIDGGDGRVSDDSGRNGKVVVLRHWDIGGRGGTGNEAALVATKHTVKVREEATGEVGKGQIRTVCHSSVIGETGVNGSVSALVGVITSCESEESLDDISGDPDLFEGVGVGHRVDNDDVRVGAGLITAFDSHHLEEKGASNSPVDEGLMVVILKSAEEALLIGVLVDGVHEGVDCHVRGNKV
jgi:hypothetical protein